jgi:hypothetical protein
MCEANEPLCGDPTFELYLEDGKDVPFTYLVKITPSLILVSVIITDEEMMGETYLVYLRGFGLDGDGVIFGTNGTSSIFEVAVSDEEAETPWFVVSEDGLPIFTFFPLDLDFRIGSSEGEGESD